MFPTCVGKKEYGAPARYSDEDVSAATFVTECHCVCLLPAGSQRDRSLVTQTAVVNRTTTHCGHAARGFYGTTQGLTTKTSVVDSEHTIPMSTYAVAKP
ncbi:hypothetical protein LSAT2_008436 [Lamellibrachia satsuma]|nr:hypothetical protein LSAT2_008436 [Lamellibrachia satsuma]